MLKTTKFYDKLGHIIGVYISEIAEESFTLNTLCGERLEYVFLPSKFKGTSIEYQARACTEIQGIPFGEIIFY